MAVCKNCGAQNPEGSVFCQGCGKSLVEASKTPDVAGAINKGVNAVSGAVDKIKGSFNSDQSFYQNAAATAAAAPAPAQGSHNDIFVDGDEQTVCTLGNGYLQNMVSKSIGTSIAVLTQKRVYFSGKCLVKNGKSWNVVRQSQVVDVQDVMGTGFTYVSRIKNLILGILFAVLGIICFFLEYYISVFSVIGGIAGIIAGIVFGLLYFLGRKTIFRIEYAGGQIGFDVKWLRYQDSLNFQRQIHLIKAKKLSDK